MLGLRCFPLAEPRRGNSNVPSAYLSSTVFVFLKYYFSSPRWGCVLRYYGTSRGKGDEDVKKKGKPQVLNSILPNTRSHICIQYGTGEKEQGGSEIAFYH